MMKKITFIAIFLLSMSSVFDQRVMHQPVGANASTDVDIINMAGRIVVTLFNDTPLHRDNFKKLAESHFYDSLLFHRVIHGFMIQAGDPMSKNAPANKLLGENSLPYTIPQEIRMHHFHRKGALCAARLGDDVNPEKASSSTQFYIVQGRRWNQDELAMLRDQYGIHLQDEAERIYKSEGGSPHLDGNYTVFGQVVSGMEVIDRIAAEPTDKADRPLSDVRILNMRVIHYDSK